jgi:hypothetical protein
VTDTFGKFLYEKEKSVVNVNAGHRGKPMSRRVRARVVLDDWKLQNVQKNVSEMKRECWWHRREPVSGSGRKYFDTGVHRSDGWAEA